MVSRPVMRYPGGKYKLAKWVIEHFPAHETYVEVFGGAASILMRKPRSVGEVYNDLDGDVVNVFRVLRDPKQAEQLSQLIYLTPFSYEEYFKAFEISDDPVERARRMIYRSFAGIGSDSVHRPHAGFRGLKNHQSGVTPATEWARYAPELAKFTERLRGVCLEQREALHVIKMYDRPGTLFYLDPPYLFSTRSRKSVMYSCEMSDAQHIELADKVKSIKGMAIVSGYASDLYTDIYKGFRQVKKQSQAQNAKPTVECLWLSPNIETTLF